MDYFFGIVYEFCFCMGWVYFVDMFVFYQYMVLFFYMNDGLLVMVFVVFLEYFYGDSVLFSYSIEDLFVFNSVVSFLQLLFLFFYFGNQQYFNIFSFYGVYSFVLSVYGDFGDVGYSDFEDFGNWMVFYLVVFFVMGFVSYCYSVGFVFFLIQFMWVQEFLEIYKLKVIDKMMIRFFYLSIILDYMLQEDQQLWMLVLFLFFVYLFYLSFGFV